MITCADRKIAFRLYKIMRELQPDWFEKKKALNELALTADEKDKLNDIAFVNMVMTRDKDDEKELYNLLGDKEYRKFLDAEFKSEKSNFHISIQLPHIHQCGHVDYRIRCALPDHALQR